MHLQRKTKGFMKKDMDAKGLREEDAANRNRWRQLTRLSDPTNRLPYYGTRSKVVVALVQSEGVFIVDKLEENYVSCHVQMGQC